MWNATVPNYTGITILIVNEINNFVYYNNKSGCFTNVILDNDAFVNSYDISYGGNDF